MRKSLLFAAGLLCLSCSKDDAPTPYNSEYQADCNSVLEFMPAPGQFINSYGNLSITTMEQACRYAFESIKSDQVVSLGAFGGYIVVGFDHSIKNFDGYDISIKSNSFQDGSEPGVVWVMQDSNKDGLPNDTWYQLGGSETGCKSTYFDYTVTYYCPIDSGMDVKWKDNYGNTGAVAYNGTYHRQSYYYPLWASQDSLVLTGTRLKDNTQSIGAANNYWICNSFEWGYADNFNHTDYFDYCNHFDIDNALDQYGYSVHLDSIDFVKVQSAIMAQCGWIGEISTEVSKISDFHLTDKQ